MTDIVTELRERSLRAEQEGEPLDLLDEAAAEIARLRDALDEQTGRAAWNYACLTECEERVIQRDAEIASLRLTDAEREALERAVSCLLWQADCEREYERRDGRGATVSAVRADDAALLSGLLERMGGGE